MIQEERICNVCLSTKPPKIHKGSSDRTLNSDFIQCISCKEWIHDECMTPQDPGLNINTAQTCPNCSAMNPTVSKRKSSRATFSISYKALNDGGYSIYADIIEKLESKTYDLEVEIRLKNGIGISRQKIWSLMESYDFLRPIIIESSEGMDMKMPKSDITTKDISNSIDLVSSLFTF
ncbi:Histone lysine demethylase PHF8 [Smittium mucronatum]|uniref:Histone lysine demethylase PHF8 n=1 Tax=Smittium mucronatum TaxID=133383 RepID=A0A1R0H028_9FUNG|nr:Histone lysine demethylase PHF8 [Smittium mucronatum]